MHRGGRACRSLGFRLQAWPLAVRLQPARGSPRLRSVPPAAPESGRTRLTQQGPAPRRSHNRHKEAPSCRPPTSTASCSPATSRATPSCAPPPSGTPVCSLRIASNTRRKTSDGEWVDKPNYFNVTVWGAQGENCARFLAKGRPVAIDGRLEWREWTAQDDSKREAVEIVADTVQFLASPDHTANRNGRARARAGAGGTATTTRTTSPSSRPARRAASPAARPARATPTTRCPPPPEPPSPTSSTPSAPGRCAVGLGAQLRRRRLAGAAAPHPHQDGRCSCARRDCPKPGKHPRTRHGLHDASTDPAQITAWWPRWRWANIGVRTGRLVVLDLDGPAAEHALHELEAAHEPLPATRCARTARGTHLYFDADGHDIPCSAGQLGPGLDVRGRGGYIIAPPSRHATGHRYRWTTSHAPAPIPHWLAELLIPPRHTATQTALPADLAGATGERARRYLQAAPTPNCSPSPAPRSGRATRRSTAPRSGSDSSPPPDSATPTSSPTRSWARRSPPAWANAKPAPPSPPACAPANATPGRYPTPAHAPERPSRTTAGRRSTAQSTRPPRRSRPRPCRPKAPGQIWNVARRWGPEGRRRLPLRWP